METVSLGQVGAEELALPPRVQEALGELVGSAKEGLLALSVGVGLGVLAELLEEEVVEIVGPKGKHIPERTAVRHRHESGEITLGGRRVGSTDPAFGALTTARSGGLRPTSTSPTATRCRVRCWSGCSPASPLAATAGRRSR